MLGDADQEVRELIAKFEKNELEAFPGRSKAETLELRILEVLNKARNEAGKLVADYSDKDTHTMIMALSGARGNLLNLAQMAACVGQQALRGEDLHRAYAGITLPNPASIRLHERFCFRPAGVFHEVGRKLDRYWDVAWYQKELGSS